MPAKKRSSEITFWRTLLEMLGEWWAILYKFQRIVAKKIELTAEQKYRLRQYSLLMRVDKPIGILLLLWPTLWALWLASDGTPPISLIIIFSLGVFLTRSAGCVINDYADRNFDGLVERTKERPLVNQNIPEKEALLLFLVLALLAFGLVLMLNWLSVVLSIIAIVIATAYPFMKRVTYFPQVVLGAAFSMSIPMAFAATNNDIPHSAWLLYVANLLWVLAYDTLYGMVDKKDDLKAGIKSTAILFGEADLQIVAIIQGFFLFGMLLVGSKFEMSFWYYIGLVCSSLLIAWQIYSCKDRERGHCFSAFLNNNWVGVCIFCGILLSKSV
ncbi:4-hydroxybenzoate octaprenyltransferase [Aliikangiella sp. IMCC44359]|uniref:4-hydroxybenzoate octaprenyltransferase n=1 Tax=Aliikangiella sp. IMCC44359 TaxID=3459125 RepID=UPI00403AAA13